MNRFKNIPWKRILSRGTSATANTVGDLMLLILKIVITVVLILVTTALIFACIFVGYIKNNYSTETDLSLSDFKVNQTSIIAYYDDDAKEYRELVQLQGEEKRIWIDYADIPTDFEHAVVAIEDKRFYEHHGVDWYRTASAFVYMFLSMSNTYGGSTLPQQLIKNLTGKDEVTVQRKILEILQALELEKNYTREEIVEWYLNIVYFGHGRYGIRAASQYYFGVEPSALSVAQIASIVGITNNPSMFSPYADEEANKERQETILSEMYSQGYIDKATYDAAVKEKLSFVNHYGNTETDLTASTKSGVYTWFEDAVIEDAIAAFMEMKDCTYKIAKELLFSGGYTIYATIDPDIQAIVDEYYVNTENFVTSLDTQLQSAIVITDPGTGDIKAMSGGVGQKTESRIFNRATDAKRSPGSSIKPLASYSLAMDNGLITPETLIEDAEEVKLEGTDWMPANDSRSYNGVIPIREALRKSLNTVAAQLIDMLTPQKSYDFLVNELHFTTLVPDDASYSPMALGSLTDGVTVREMATAYGIFPNMGLYVSSRTFSRITDSAGHVVYENNTRCNVAISDTTAYWMTDMLTEAANYGTGYEAPFEGMHCAGKTGTQSSNTDRWFCGFTPYYVAAVWTGYDNPDSITWSGNPSSQTWHAIMSKIHENLPDKEWESPASTYQPTVIGVEAIPYTVNYQTVDGKVLETEKKESTAGREITLKAKEIEGYTLVGESEQKIIIDEKSDNIYTFTYKSNTPDPVIDPENPPVDDPANPPVDNPTDPGI